ncbi:MAG: hypothetical protein QM831_45190 [Kofleriaceae bacterium]
MRALALILVSACAVDSADFTNEQPGIGSGSAIGSGSDTGSGSGSGSAARTCVAQRAVFISGGNGGLAWFTQVWPVPYVIDNFAGSYAFDDPSKVTSLTVEAAHPLYGRNIGDHAIWPATAMVIGTNEAHTVSPTSTTSYAGIGLQAAVASLQTALPSTIPVVQFANGGYYGGATNAPDPLVVADVSTAIAAFPADVQAQLTPSNDQLLRYNILATTQAQVDFGTQLAFTANALSLGLVTTVALPGTNDDPHDAFDNGQVPTQYSDSMAIALDAFYADLAAAPDPSCDSSLADNTVMVINGDTYKAPFDRIGWNDATPGVSNVAYVRSNGFLRTGWFAPLGAGVRTSFDVTNGDTIDYDEATTKDPDDAAAFASVLYAVSRGNRTAVTNIVDVPYTGLIR